MKPLRITKWIFHICLGYARRCRSKGKMGSNQLISLSIAVSDRFAQGNGVTNSRYAPGAAHFRGRGPRLHRNHSSYCLDFVGWELPVFFVSVISLLMILGPLQTILSWYLAAFL